MRSRVNSYFLKTAKALTYQTSSYAYRCLVRIVVLAIAYDDALGVKLMCREIPGWI